MPTRKFSRDAIYAIPARVWWFSRKERPSGELQIRDRSWIFSLETAAAFLSSFETNREATNPPFLRGGFCFGVFAFFCIKYKKKTPQTKKRGLRKRGFVDSRESTNPPFFKGGGVLFGGFYLFFCPKYRKKTPQTKNGGYENGGCCWLSTKSWLRFSARTRTLGLPSLQKCVCEIFGEIWFGIRFEI